MTSISFTERKEVLYDHAREKLTGGRRFAFLRTLLALAGLLGISASASAALVEYAGANRVAGSAGVSRHVRVRMIFDDPFVKNPGTPSPVRPLRLTTPLLPA